MGPEFATGVEGGVDAGVDVVAENGAEFAAAGFDEHAFDDGAVGASVVADVSGDGAAAEVDVFADDAVAEVVLVGGGAAVEHDGVFEFAGLSDAAVVSDGGVGTEPAVGTDLAVFANADGAVDDDAGADPGAFADGDGAGDVSAGVDFAFDFGGHGVVEQVGVGVEEVPGVADGEPVALGFDDVELALLGEGLYGGGDLDFAAFGEGSVFEDVEDVGLEFVGADVGEVGEKFLWAFRRVVVRGCRR